MESHPSGQPTDPQALSRYAYLPGSLAQAVVFLNADGRIVDANPAAERILGAPLEQLRQVPPFDARWQLTKEDGAPLEVQDYPVTIALRTGRPVRDVVVAHGTGAARRWLRLSAVPIAEPPSSDPTLVIAVFEDITDAHRTTEALKRSEERFRLIAECTEDVLWEWDLQSNVLTYFGRVREELRGRSKSAPFESWLDMVDKDERESLLSDLRTTVAGGTVFHRRHLLRWGSSMREGITRAVVVRDPEGTPLRVVGATNDVTDQRRAEREREESLNLFRAVIEGTRDPIYVKDREGRFRMLNAAAAQRLGVSDAAHALGRDNRDFLPAELADRFAAEEAQVLRTGRSVTYESEGWGTAADRTYLTTKLPLHAPGGELTGTITIARDVTELKSLEIRLRQSQKMEAIGRLAGGVAHDFNNLLMVIIGCCSEVHDQIVSVLPSAADNIAEVLKAADRAALLTRQLLAFSRRQLLEPRVTDLNEIVGNAERMFRRIIGEDILLRTRLADDLGVVHVDPGQIEQVLLNLVVNARDAMPRGGHLTIETANLDLSESTTGRHHEAQAGQYVSLSVSDTGVGMDRATQAKIFEPFFTTKKHGTGLGLATVYGIVKQSGGEVWVDSQPGAGSTFTVLLPVHQDGKEESAAASVPRTERGSELILLVEDERSLRELLAKALTRHGYRVMTAGQGDEALILLNRETETPALLITDVIMPGMDGHTLALRVRERLPAIRVLYMSGFADHALLDTTTLDTDDRFLQKPFTPATLLRTVRSILDTRES